MSHFLSKATQQRLEVRKVDSEATNEPSMQCYSTCIPGQLRCLASVSAKVFSSDNIDTSTLESLNSGGDDTTTVWTGEADGTISIRHMSSGIILNTIPKKVTRMDATGRVFVFTMCSPRHDQVWAGMSDGSVQVFHSQTCEVLLEFRAHSSAVTAMTTVSMPTNDAEFEHHMNVVITASTDWTIAKWDTTTFHCLGKLNGHRLSVKCLAASVSGEFLLSGGEDGVLHMWSLMHNEEVVRSNTASLVGEEGNREADVNSVPMWPVQAHSAAVSSILFIRDAYIASAGLDGAAYVWTLQGICVHVLEKRQCGLTSLLFDSVGSRLWVGGIDGVLRLYNDNIEFGEAPWTELGSALDHSGAYISAAQVVREDHLQRVWLIDESGMATYFIETFDRDVSDTNAVDNVEGGIAESEMDALETIDACRQEIVQSYSELRHHRIRLAKAESSQRAQREVLVGKFGDCARERQYAVFKLQRWVMKRQETASASLRAEWFAGCSERAFSSGCFWKWLLWAREVATTRQKTKTTEVVRSLTTTSWKDAAARQLKLALDERRRRVKMQPLITALMERGQNRMRSRYFVQWFLEMLQRRKSASRSHVAASRTRLQEVTLHAIQQRQRTKDQFSARHLAQMTLLSDILVSCRQRAVCHDAFHTWYATRSCHALQRRTVRAAVDMMSSSHMQLRSTYLHKWHRWLMGRKADSEDKKADDLQAELRMWEELIREASSINVDTLRYQLQEEQEKSFLRAERLGALKQQASAILDDIHDIKTFLVVDGLQLQAGLDIPSRVDAIFTYMKARGISAKQDVAVIKLSRDEYSTMPLYVAPPPPQAPKPSASPVRTVAVRKPSNSPAAPRRSSAPTATTPVKKKEPPLPRHLIGEFEILYKKLKQLVRTTVANPSPDGNGNEAQFLLSLSNVQETSILDDEDWGVTPEAIQKLPRKDIRDCANCLRKMIVLYDCIKHKQEEAVALQSMYRVATPVQSSIPTIPVHVLRQILCNAPAMLKLATHDFCLSALEYVTVRDDDVQEASSSPPKSVAPQAPAVIAAPATQRAAAVASSGTPPRRHSSPAASLRPPSATLPKGKALVGNRMTVPLPKPSAPAAAAVKGTAAEPSRTSLSLDGLDQSDGGNQAPSPRPHLAESNPSPKPSPRPKAASQGSPLKPFIGLRLAVGPPLIECMRTPSLVVAECNESYSRHDSEEDKIAGPAFVAGLRVGDILQRFAGYVVTDLQAFNTIVNRHARPGAVIPVQVLDGGSRETKSVTIVVGSR